MKPANVLSIKTLSDDWSDKDMVILHACFQLLVNCIEEEKLFEFIDWESNNEAKKIKTEIQELHNWWIERTEAEKKNGIDSLWSDEQYKEDDEMLIRLIKIRKYLWT
jgi:hypothetical protein